jgi:hypothetical protein
MRPILKVLTFATVLAGFGGVATAQQAPAGPRGPGSGPTPGRAEAPRNGGGVTAILNARRVLDLTPRQVAQLDSIERGLHAERQRVTAAMRPAMDSMRQRVREQGIPRDPAQRQQLQQQAEQRRAALRPQLEQLRTRDSAATATAERLLTDAQRGTLREMRAERRGFERGMRAGRGPGRESRWQGPRGERRPSAQERAGRQGRPDMMRAPQGQRPDRSTRSPDA